MTLSPFSSVDRSTLRWLRTAETPLEFTLLAGEATVAILRWAAHRGSLAAAETAEGTWTLKRTGFLTPRLTVRSKDSPAEVANLTAHLRHHTIQLTGGPSYWLRRAGILLPAWRLRTEEGQELLHVEPIPEGHKLGAGAVLVESGKDDPACLLLVVLSWYFIVLAWFEDETAEALTPY